VAAIIKIRRYVCKGCPRNQPEYEIVNGKAKRNPNACRRPCERLLKQLKRIHKSQREMSGGIGSTGETNEHSREKLACEIDLFYHGNYQDPIIDDGASPYLSHYWTAPDTFCVPYLTENSSIRHFADPFIFLRSVLWHS